MRSSLHNRPISGLARYTNARAKHENERSCIALARLFCRLNALSLKIQSRKRRPDQQAVSCPTGRKCAFLALVISLVLPLFLLPSGKVEELEP